MKSYSNFASFYDGLTKNVDYKALAKYFDGLINKYGNGGNLLLDLACGTGSLSIELAKMGYDVVATDISEQMLSEAQSKVETFGNPIFLCQSMQNLDMFGTIDAVVCSLDSINHIESQEDVKTAIEKVSLFMNPGAVFIFDVNTLYKHREVLGQNTFVYDTDDVYCVWQNCFDSKDGSVEISLDFFEELDDGAYERSEECFKEYYYSDVFLSQAVKNSGMSVISRFDGFSENEANEKSERVVYVCRKD